MATKEYAHQYRLKNLERCRAYDREWRSRHRERLNKKTNDSRRENRVRLREMENKRNQLKRLKILWILGGVCSKCGFSDDRALQIDHVKGNGNEERRIRNLVHNYGSWMRVLAERKNDYQILCANCNWIKRADMKEFGKRKPLETIK